MGKALQVVLSEMTVKDAASASLTNIYRKQEQVNKSLKMGEQQATRTQKSLEKMSAGMKMIGQNIQKISGGAIGSAGTAMNSGGSGLIAKIPGIGGLFSAASSAVESAAQEFVAGISASKNIKMLSSNFAAAMGIGLDKSIYRARDRMSAYTKLGDMGADKDLIKKNQGTLEQFAKSQGLGSMEEAIQALASGQIKQGRGLSASQIDLMNGYKELLGNAHTVSTGLELMFGVIKDAEKGTKKYADALDKKEMYRNKKGKMVAGGSTADLIAAEGSIQTAEENYMAGGASLFGGSYGSMNKTRTQDRLIRSKTMGIAQGVSKMQNKIIGRGLGMVEALQEGGLSGAADYYKRQSASDDEVDTSVPKAEGGPVQAGRMYTVGEHGRETFIPNTSGRIASAQETKRMGGKSGTTIINNITVPLQGFADILERETIKAMNKAGRTILPMHLGVQPRG